MPAPEETVLEQPQEIVPEPQIPDEEPDRKQETQSAREAFEKLKSQGHAPRMADLVLLISEQVGVQEIADWYTRMIKTGTDTEKRSFTREYVEMMKQVERLDKTLISEDEVARLTKEQIEGMLEYEYGYVKQASKFGFKERKPKNA